MSGIFSHTILILILLSGSALARDGITWTALSTTRGELPPPNGSNQQTTCVTADVDNDGDTDFFITDRSTTPSVILYRRTAAGWEICLVDDSSLPIEAGGDAGDIDGDGDLDLVLGQDSSGGTVWWWENPHPNIATNTPWTRRVIKTGGSDQHDQRLGDFDGDGDLEFATWINNSGRVEIYEIPADPTTSPWILADTLTLSGEGMDVIDVDRDGVDDILAGGHWISHDGGSNYSTHPIDASYVASRIVAAQFIPGGRPEVFLNSGDASGPLKFYSWNGSAWISSTLISTVDHGHSLEYGDVDGDGHLDVFAAEMGSPGAGSNCKAWIGWGDGAGGFTVEEISTGIANHMSRLADVDGDGDLDIIMKPYNYEAPRVDVYINNGTGNVRITEAVDEGRICYKIETPQATWYFDKAGGGFTSLLDKDGTDWISWNPAVGSGGNYRGIPNLEHFHPGLDGGTSTTADPLNTPLLSASIETSRNGWGATWEFFARHARMTLHTVTGINYWILYEGTPGGAIGADDRLHLSNGRDYSANLDHPWSSASPSPDNFDDIANTSGAANGTEWAYVAAGETNRSIYLVHTDDTIEDDYWQMDDNMTVLGFGRADNSTPLMSAISNVLVVGFAESTHPDVIQDALHTAWDARAPMGVPPEPPFSGLPFIHSIIDSNNVGHRVIADMNNDGSNDVLSANFISGAHQVVWYEYPDWTRHVVVDVSTYGDYQNYRSDDMAAADIDNDGDNDIVGRLGPANDSNGPIVWWENPLPDGDPASDPWVRHDVGDTDYNKDLVVEDFDLDGKLDIAARENSETHVFRQVSPTSWTRVLQLSHSSHEGMSSGDLDADGDADLVLNGFWLRNPHPAALTDTWTLHSIDSKWYTQSGSGWQDNNSNIDVSDMDGDGSLDVILSQSELPGYPLSWYSAADPVNGPWIEHIIEPVFDYCQTVQAGDINRDGLIDILAAEFPRYDAPYPVRIYYNEGNGASWTIQELSDTGIYHGTLGDVGNDRDLDIVGVRSFDTAPIEIWENQLANLILPLTDWHYIQVDDSRAKWGDWDTPTWSKYFGLDMADLTGDGYKDIVSGRYFYRNPGGLMTNTWPRIDVGLNCDAALISDVDGDSFGDVIAPAGDKVYWLEMLDAAGATWSSTVIDPAFPKSDHGNPQGYQAAQIIAGGKNEILLNDEDLILYEVPGSNPEGGNWPRTTIVTEANGEAIGVGDMDGDGNLDVAVAHVGPAMANGTIKWARNPGDGSGNWTQFPVGSIDNRSGYYPDRIEVADLNGDGHPDIVVSEETQATTPSANTYWFEAPSNPTNSNWVRHTLAVQHTSNAMDARDMDNDGDIDIILGEHRVTEKMAVWENDGFGNFSEHIVDTGKESHLGARTADLDDDGDYDIVSICWDDHQDLHVWRNDNGGLGTVIRTNQPPVVSAGSDKSLFLPNNQIALDGTITNDGKPSGGAITSLWSVVSGPPGATIANVTNEDTTATFPGIGTWVLRLEAGDSRLTASDEMTVRVWESGSDIVLYWTLNEGSGTAANDISPYGNSGTLNGAGWDTGRSSGALSLDGGSDYTTLPSGSLAGAFPSKDPSVTDFSVCAWIKLDTLGHRNPICGKQGNEQRGFMFMTEDSNVLALEVFRATGSSGSRVHSPSALSADTWYHVAATYEYVTDGTSRIRLYIDGADAGGSDSAEGPITVNTTSFDVGRYYWSSSHHPHFDGLIDEVQVFSRKLSEAEIQQVMTGDADMDGMPDDWELSTMNTIGNSGSADGDGDRITNYGEYIADTHPADSNDVLQLNLSVRSNQVEVIFDSSTSRLYNLQSTAPVVPFSWQNVVTDHPGAGPLDSLTVPSPTNTARLYRLRVRMP